MCEFVCIICVLCSCVCCVGRGIGNQTETNQEYLDSMDYERTGDTRLCLCAVCVFVCVYMTLSVCVLHVFCVYVCDSLCVCFVCVCVTLSVCVLCVCVCDSFCVSDEMKGLKGMGMNFDVPLNHITRTKVNTHTTRFPFCITIFNIINIRLCFVGSVLSLLWV